MAVGVPCAGWVPWAGVPGAGAALPWVAGIGWLAGRGWPSGRGWLAGRAVGAAGLGWRLGWGEVIPCLPPGTALPAGPFLAAGFPWAVGG